MKGARRLSALFFFPAALSIGAPALADDDSNVNSAFADPGLTTLTIRGANLVRKKAPRVYLSGFSGALAIQSAISSQIVVQLPAGVTPGSYVVSVRSGGEGNDDDFAVTLGAQGAKGEKGDKGDKGDPPIPCACASSNNLYANSQGTGATAASLTVAESGPFALSGRIVLQVENNGPTGTMHCTLSQLGPFVVVDKVDLTTLVPALTPVVFQAAVIAPAPMTKYAIDCTRDGFPPGTVPGGFSYWSSKIQALRVDALISPSP